MTNFEKWKEKLTAVELGELIVAFAIDCSQCPALEECDRNPNVPCSKLFLQWAEKEYIAPPPKMVTYTVKMEKPEWCEECRFIKGHIAHGKLHQICMLDEHRYGYFNAFDHCPLVEIEVEDD